MSSLSCDRFQTKPRSTLSWLPSWWRSSKSGGHVNAGTGNPCDCGLIQLRVGGREDLQMPVFTTKVAPTCIIGKHHIGELKLSKSKNIWWHYNLKHLLQNISCALLCCSNTMSRSCVEIRSIINIHRFQSMLI